MNCSSCGYENQTAKYCENCGKKLFELKSADTSKDKQHLLKLFVIYGVLLIYLLIDTFLLKDETPQEQLITEYVFYAIIIIFALIFWKDWVRLLKFTNVRLKPLLILLPSLIALAFIVDLVVEPLNQFLGKGTPNYYITYLDSSLPLLSSLFHIALLPALFEEISFRGFVFTQTNNFVRLKGTIFVTSFLFFFLHLSIISIVWLFGIGLVFGYFRARYRTLWYGIIGHFTYNGVLVLIDYYHFTQLGFVLE